MKAYQDKKLLMYSLVKNNWPKKDEISIFDSSRQLVLKVNHNQISKENFKILNQNSKKVEKINSGLLKLENKDKIRIKLTIGHLILNPYARIYLNSTQIGKVNSRKIGLSLNYKLFVNIDYSEYLPEILKLFLVQESNKDYDHTF